MKKIILIAVFFGMVVVRSFGQLIDEQNVTVTMDLQPVLQLNMTTPDMVTFTFDQIYQYMGGEIKYSATVLQVSSSVNWDLWAVGTSQNLGTTVAAAVVTTDQAWDMQMEYNSAITNTNAQTQLPLSLLELHQTPINGGAITAGDDYSSVFTPVPAPPYAGALGTNSIYDCAPANAYVLPAVGNRFIEGDNGLMTGAAWPTYAGGMPGGSYLATTSTLLNDPYYVRIDYRIVPGLPTIFPMAEVGVVPGTSAALVAPAFAAPGVYTMDVKYILAEDQ